MCPGRGAQGGGDGERWKGRDQREGDWKRGTLRKGQKKTETQKKSKVRVIKRQRNRSEPETGKVRQAKAQRWRYGCVWQRGENCVGLSTQYVFRKGLQTRWSMPGNPELEKQKWREEGHEGVE